MPFKSMGMKPPCSISSQPFSTSFARILLPHLTHRSEEGWEPCNDESDQEKESCRRKHRQEEQERTIHPDKTDRASSSAPIGSQEAALIVKGKLGPSIGNFIKHYELDEEVGQMLKQAKEEIGWIFASAVEASLCLSSPSCVLLVASCGLGFVRLCSFFILHRHVVLVMIPRVLALRSRSRTLPAWVLSISTSSILMMMSPLSGSW